MTITLCDLRPVHGWPGAGKRAALAGMAWGVPMAAFFVMLEFGQHGVLCVSDAAMTFAVTLLGGISTIGVFAAFFRGVAPGQRAGETSARKANHGSKAHLYLRADCG